MAVGMAVSGAAGGPPGTSPSGPARLEGMGTPARPSDALDVTLERHRVADQLAAGGEGEFLPAGSVVEVFLAHDQPDAPGLGLELETQAHGAALERPAGVRVAGDLQARARLEDRDGPGDGGPIDPVDAELASCPRIDGGFLGVHPHQDVLGLEQGA